MADEPHVNWTGMLVPGTNLRGLLDHFCNEAIEKAEDRSIKTTVLVIGWDDSNFTQHAMVPTEPAEIKRLADMLASASAFWYEKWEATQDPDDYGKGEEYVS